MKKFLEAVVEIKSWACLCFTAEMFIYTVCALAYGQTAIDCVMVFQLLGAALAVTLLQYVFFSGKVMKKTRYSLRVVLFSIPLGGVIALFAVMFHWFPVDSGLAWLAFFGIYFLWLALFTAGFEIYFRITGKKYGGLLGEYRKKREREP